MAAHVYRERIGKMQKKKDLAEKIIEAEIQKEGKLLEACMQEEHVPDIFTYTEGCPEDELQELLKKREIYQAELEKESEEYRQQEEQRKHRRYSSMVKVAMLVLVTGGCLFAFSMRSEATRMWWLSSVEKIIGSNRGNYVDNDENRVYSDTTEEEAAAEIEEKIGIQVPEFYYLPQGMYFDSYEYDTDIKQGFLRYCYDDGVVHLLFRSADEDSSYSSIYDGESMKETIIEMDYGTVRVTDMQAKDDTVSNIEAKWVYRNCQYELIGKLSLEEITLIIENIFY